MFCTIFTKRKLLLCVLTVLLCLVIQAAHAQEHNMVRYHWVEGFNASKGYCIFQDHKGYIWIGTDRGLFRFNGYNFKRYTTQDGLPGNEILDVTEENNGRLWLGPFAGSVCYMENGRIFNADNDSLLKQLRFESRAAGILFDRYGNKWLTTDEGSLRRIDPQGRITHIIIKFPGNYTPKLNSYCINAGGQLEIMADDRILCWTGSSFGQTGRLKKGFNKVAALTAAYFMQPDSGILIFRNGAWKGGSFRFPIRQNTHTVGLLNGHEVISCTTDGAYSFDLETGKPSDSFLTGGYKNVNRYLVARDGSLWFTTLGDGLYRLPSSTVKTIALQQPVYVVSVQAVPGGVRATTDRGIYLKADAQADGSFKTGTTFLKTKHTYEYFKLVMQNSKKQWLCFGGGATSVKNTLAGPTIQELRFNTKAVLPDTGGYLWLGCIYGIYHFDTREVRITDTFLKNIRILSLAHMSDTIYAGTFNGLTAFTPGSGQHSVLANEPALRNSIPALCVSKSHELWAASSRGELVIIRNDKIAGRINFKNGLLCNRISCMQSGGGHIWVGTDNGLFAVTAVAPYKVVKHISYATGLTSNEVNCIDILNGRIWVGTAAGINYVDENGAFYKQDTATIFINSITNGENIFHPSPRAIELRKGALDIDFDVIDFSGGSRPFFEYRLNNDSAWTSLSDNHLVFPAIPWGDFTVDIRAYAPNWASAAVFRQSFYNPPPFYLRWWFVVVALVILVVLSISVIALANRRILRKKNKDLAVQQNLLLLEQMALQGQMNPHFIFNCITAIKQYYSSGDVDKAEDFTDAFALLIRQTFEMSGSIFITLDKELDYLKQYLDVEQARFNHSFQYRVTKNMVTAAINIPVPAMLLQPVLENAIRHGIRHLPDGEGLIEIDVTETGENIQFAVTDNGIGLQKSKAIKTQAALNAVTSSVVNTKRINILNRLFRDKITVRTESVSDKENTGTRVVISYPVNIRQYIHYESDHS